MNIIDIIKKAKIASFDFKKVDNDVRNNVLADLAVLIEENINNIIESNKKDIIIARENGLLENLIDRLSLNKERINSIITGLQDIIKLEDPTNIILEERNLENGLNIKKVSVPFGTIGIIYESRPNVTIDCAALCIKSSNTCVLKGGKEAYNTNKYLVSLIHEALIKNKLSKNVVVFLDNPSREETTKLMKAKKYIDLLIPRGSANLINYTVENASVPVIETGAGITHVYIDKDYDEIMATNIIINAKTSRPSVCNSLETLLVHKEISSYYLPKIYDELKKYNVVLKGNKEVKDIIDIELINDDEYDVEHLNLTLSVKIVKDVDDAINHINTFGTKHSESIVSNNLENVKKFFVGVDAATIYHNASTRFTDGFIFGLGAEIGISTQKMHARGPMGLKELCTYTYHIEGSGQIR